MARVNLDKEEIQKQAEEKFDSPVLISGKIFEQVAHNQKNKKEPMKNNPENDEPVAKKDVLQRNIRKLEQLREKSYDKEV